MRKLIMLAMLLASFGANAAPVSLAFTSYQWHFARGVYGGGATNTYDVGDGYPLNTPTYDRTITSVGPNGSAQMRTYWSTEFSSEESDDSYSFHTLLNMGLEGYLDAGVGSMGRAAAQVNLERMFIYFDVLEPVLYTGTVGLHASGDNPFSPGAVDFASGDVVEAGRYIAVFNAGIPSLALLPGQSDAISGTFLYDFNFVAVPLPGSLALVFFGLLGIGLRKKVAGGRTLAN